VYFRFDSGCNSFIFKLNILKMIKEPLTIEELEIALKIPSFEEELALSDLPHRLPLGVDKSAHVSTCKKCGTQFMVGPGQSDVCPKAPHDPEDDILFPGDPLDDSDEDIRTDEEFYSEDDRDYGLY
jgi:hypothetical protein